MKNHVFVSLFLCGFAVCQEKKNAWNRETSQQRLDDVIVQEFKARDANKDGQVTFAEIREYYEAHPEKMTKEGLSFLERNLDTNASVDVNEYRTLVKNWLAQNGSVEKILNGVFGNNTRHLPTHHVWRTTASP